MLFFYFFNYFLFIFFFDFFLVDKCACYRNGPFVGHPKHSRHCYCIQYAHPHSNSAIKPFVVLVPGPSHHIIERIRASDFVAPWLLIVVRVQARIPHLGNIHRHAKDSGGEEVLKAVFRKWENNVYTYPPTLTYPRILPKRTCHVCCPSVLQRWRSMWQPSRGGRSWRSTSRLFPVIHIPVCGDQVQAPVDWVA